MAEGVKYIKISKKDKNGVDKTPTLQSLTELTIPYSTGNVRYDILDIVEKPTFFLYRVENPGIEFNDHAEIQYNFTGSVDSTQLYYSEKPTSKFTTLVPLTASFGDQSHFLDNSTGYYKQLTYPHKDVTLKVSGTFSVLAGGDNAQAGIYKLESDGSITELYLYPGFFTAGATPSINISVAVTASLPGDVYAFGINGGTANSTYTTCSLTNLEFFTTSTPATGPSFNTIPEPYFSSDFSRALDCQPTLNNAVNSRTGHLHQDIDYNSGAITPTNFDLLISGSALNATVQDSNYTLLRHTNPRYNGSRSTSQKINEWTEGDVGTFGKVPSVESLKTYVAFCDWIGGTTPELTNASGAHIKYLIDENGDILDPNTSEFSLTAAQGTFLPKETTRIKWDLPGVSDTRKIIRGGSTVRTIIYNQIGHPTSTPAMSFTSSINFEDVLDNGATATPDYQAVLKKTANQTVTSAGGWTKIDFPIVLTEGDDIDSGHVGIGLDTYEVSASPGTLQTLVFKSTIKSLNLTGNEKGGNAIRLYNSTTGEQVGAEVYLNGDGFVGNLETTTTEIEIAVPPINLTEGDVYELQFKTTLNSMLLYSNAQFIIEQIPSPSGNSTEVSTTSLINVSSNQTTHPGVYITNVKFLSFYGSPHTRQTEIEDSGFDRSDLSLEFQPGDEIRFEGDEDKVFMIEKAEIVLDFPDALGTSTLYLQTNKEVDSSSINQRQFVIRRFIDDPSLILFEGFKPSNSVGPYILTPQFVSSKLDNNINQYLTDLTQKGLI
jgi:hypothetical protein